MYLKMSVKTNKLLYLFTQNPHSIEIFIFFTDCKYLIQVNINFLVRKHCSLIIFSMYYSMYFYLFNKE